MITFFNAIVAETACNDCTCGHAERIVVVESLKRHGNEVVEDPVRERVGPVLLRAKSYFDVEVGQQGDVQA